MAELSPFIKTLFSPQLFLALVIALAIIPLLRRFALTIKLIDHPGGRKQHQSPVPLIGGVVIFISASSSLLYFGVPEGFNGFMLAALGLFIIGLIDDKYDVSAKLRLIIQTALVVLALHIDNNWFTAITLTAEIRLDLGQFSYPLSVILVLGLINAVNMLDGIDGLSSGVVMIILGFIIGLSISANLNSVVLISTTLLGAVAGFWAFNYRFAWREKATIFMGDSGTIVLGFALAYLAIKMTSLSPTVTPNAILLWLFAVPIWDICAVIIKRLRTGKSPLKAGRDHIHHVLMRAGLSVRQTLHLIYLLTVATISFGISIQKFGFSQIEAFTTFFVFMMIYLGRVGSLSRNSREVDQILDHRKEPLLNKESENIVELAARTRSNTIS